MDRTVGFGYVERPESEKEEGLFKVTPKWIREGDYEIEVMGKRIPGEVHTKAVFDPQGLRVQGVCGDEKK